MQNTSFRPPFPLSFFNVSLAMAKVLILFAHPVLEKSRVQKALIRKALELPNVSVRDLYELYPDFNIDIPAEKRVLAEHDVIVWQHPFYWYSAPAIIKQWIDLVLEYGWAYGPGGKALEGKRATNAITTGGPEAVYQPEGRNRFTIRQFLAPFDQTVTLCNMTYIEPFVIHGTHKLSAEALVDDADRYARWLKELTHE